MVVFDLLLYPNLKLASILWVIYKSENNKRAPLFNDYRQPPPKSHYSLLLGMLGQLRIGLSCFYRLTIEN
jgi:hypothetical protein